LFPPTCISPRVATLVPAPSMACYVRFFEEGTLHDEIVSDHKNELSTFFIVFFQERMVLTDIGNINMTDRFEGQQDSSAFKKCFNLFL
jgi:hypothetical protein